MNAHVGCGGWIIPMVIIVSVHADEITSEVFGPRSSPAGATLFTELSGEATGIIAENNYADPRMWGDRNAEFALGGMGTGVAIGDYDNDGRPDLFVMSKTEECRLFRNLGNWKFVDVTDAAGLLPADEQGTGDSVLGGLFGREASSGAYAGVEAWKQGATFADVNNDGWLDLYVCRWGVPNWLFINRGDGTFSEEAAARGLAVVDASGIGAFCDYDRDGWLDVYVQTNMLNALTSGDGQRDYLFRNRGDGTFVDVTEAAGISGKNLAHSSTWWDFNQDGWPDLYVANDFATPDRLYRNNGDGTFTDVIHRVLPTMPYSAMGSDLGDVNNDGLIDLFVADMAATSHETDQRGAATSREMSRVDADSDVQSPQRLRNTLFLNTGLARFQEAAVLAGIAATDWTWSVRFEDLDNDGWLDLHVTNGMAREFQNADLRDQVIRAGSPAASVRIMRDSRRLDEANFAFRNRGDPAAPSFADVSAEWGLNQQGVSFGAAFGDLDGDGDLDLVIGNFEQSVTILRNDCTTGHRAVVALRGTTSNRFGLGAKVTIETAAGRQVRLLTAVRGYFSASEPVAHFGLGTAERIDRLTVEWPSGVVQHFDNLPADHRYTIQETVTASSGGDLPSDRGSAPALFDASAASVPSGLILDCREDALRENPGQPLLPLRFGRLGPALAVGDLNGDGRDDVVLGGTTRTPARMLGATGDGAFASASLAALTAHPTLNDGPLLLFDADGDGDTDLLLTRTTDGLPAGDRAFQPVLLWNGGGGGFSPAAAGVLPELPVSIGAVAAVDFDRDGRLDVFLGGRIEPGEYPSSPRSVLLHNEGGRFTDATATEAPDLARAGLVTSALWSDVDDDGWPDLLVATEWGPVRAWRNAEGRALVEQTEAWGFAAAGAGWWTSLAAGDFNGDGRMDYVAGNAGLNTPYRASAAEPAVLYRGDFRGRGRGAKRIIEAYYENGRLLPRRTSKVLSGVIPAIARQFRRNDDFAAADLYEIVGEEKLAAAERYAVSQLCSGVFLSRTGGGHVFAPLPSMAQIAPLQGMVTGDFDGDGYCDVVAVQNSFAPISCYGRFDGGVGQFLRGRGDGSFEALSPWASGFLIEGDAKALVRLDLNGDSLPDLLASRNNGPTRAWLTRADRSQPDLTRVQVRLSGAAAAGARVALVERSGRRRIEELHLGAGYFSQSTPAAFFAGFDATDAVVEVRWGDAAVTKHPLPSAGHVLTLAR